LVRIFTKYPLYPQSSASAANSRHDIFPSPVGAIAQIWATFGEGETRYELTNNRPKCRSAIALRLYLKAEIAYSFVTSKKFGSLK